MRKYVDIKDVIDFIKNYFGVTDIVTIHNNGWYNVYLPIYITEEEYNKFVRDIEKELDIVNYTPGYEEHECGSVNNYYLRDVIKSLKDPESTWVEEGGEELIEYDNYFPEFIPKSTFIIKKCYETLKPCFNIQLIVDEKIPESETGNEEE